MLNQRAFLRGNTCAAIVVAAGAGSRLGGPVSKQFQRVGGKPMLLWSVEALLQCEEIGSVVVVLPAEGLAGMAGMLPTEGRIITVAGGPSRTDSVRNGLAALAARPPDKVLIHDAARPGLDAFGDPGTDRRTGHGRRRRPGPADDGCNQIGFRGRRPPVDPARGAGAGADAAGFSLAGDLRGI